MVTETASNGDFSATARRTARTDLTRTVVVSRQLFPFYMLLGRGPGDKYFHAVAKF